MSETVRAREQAIELALEQALLEVRRKPPIWRSPPGFALLFGRLYARHRTIVGVTVSHYILGVCIFGPLQLVR